MPPAKTASATRTTVKRGPGRPRKAVAAQFQEPLIDEPQGPERPAMHDGVKIVKEELVSALPHGKGPFRFTRLHLADGNQAYGCRDCLETRDNRGAILLHRNEAHGARNGKKPANFGMKPLAQTGGTIDLVLPPRGGNPGPTDPMQMTLGEILGLMPSIGAIGDLIDRLEHERDEALAEASKNRIDKSTQHKIDVYELNRTELVELRLHAAKTGNYEEIKAEMYELRAWKKKMIAKLSALGFKLSEEDD